MRVDEMELDLIVVADAQAADGRGRAIVVDEYGCIGCVNEYGCMGCVKLSKERHEASDIAGPAPTCRVLIGGPWRLAHSDLTSSLPSIFSWCLTLVSHIHVTFFQ